MTQTATLARRATDAGTQQPCTNAVEEEALAEYVPDATILLPGARLKASLQLPLG